MFGKAEKISEAELEIMRVIWANNSPTTYKHIRKVLGGDDGWDSSTIRTLIRRLVEKGILLQEKQNVYYYTATLSESDFKKDKTKEFLRKIYGGNAKNLIAAMCSEEFLSSDEMEDIRDFWKKGRDKSE